MSKNKCHLEFQVAFWIIFSREQSIGYSDLSEFQIFTRDSPFISTIGDKIGNEIIDRNIDRN